MTLMLKTVHVVLLCKGNHQLGSLLESAQMDLHFLRYSRRMVAFPNHVPLPVVVCILEDALHRETQFVHHLNKACLTI